MGGRSALSHGPGDDAMAAVPPILDPHFTAYCAVCQRNFHKVCAQHQLVYRANLDDPAEFYAKAGRL